MALYHRDVFMPDVARRLRFAVMLKYSNHARHAAKDDKRGKVNLPRVLDSREATLIEAEVVNGRVVKLVYRMAHDDKTDVSLVVLPDGFVKTVWLNEKNDHHKTLNTSRYASC